MVNITNTIKLTLIFIITITITMTSAITITISATTTTIISIRYPIPGISALRMKCSLDLVFYFKKEF